MVESEVLLDMLVQFEMYRICPDSNVQQAGYVSLGRVWEPSGTEIELWESLTYRSLGTWEKGENPGYCKGEMLYYNTQVLLIGTVLLIGAVGIAAPK